jgi:RNA chaperone Hfq
MPTAAPPSPETAVSIPSPLKIFEEEITKLRNSLQHIERRLSKLQELPFKSASDLINDYLEQHVTVLLRSGATLSGKYLRYDKYHIAIEIEGRQVLIFKHAIESMRETSGTAPTPAS